MKSYWYEIVKIAIINQGGAAPGVLEYAVAQLEGREVGPETAIAIINACLKEKPGEGGFSNRLNFGIRIPHG